MALDRVSAGRETVPFPAPCQRPGSGAPTRQAQALLKRPKRQEHRPATRTVVLSPRRLSDLDLLLNGGFSPLRGFLGRADYDSVLDAMRLESGGPPMLDVTDAYVRGTPSGRIAAPVGRASARRRHMGLRRRRGFQRAPIGRARRRHWGIPATGYRIARRDKRPEAEVVRTEYPEVKPDPIALTPLLHVGITPPFRLMYHWKRLCRASPGRRHPPVGRALARRRCLGFRRRCGFRRIPAGQARPYRRPTTAPPPPAGAFYEPLAFGYPEVIDEPRRVYPPRGRQGFTL